MMDAINGINDSFSDHSESERNSRSESSSTSRNQSYSSSEYSGTVKESDSSETQHDSKHTIGPLNSNIDPKVDIKSERQPIYSSLIIKELLEPYFSYNENKKKGEKPHNSNEENKEEIDENSENYIDRYLRSLQEEGLKKNFNENKSHDDKEFKQTQLERNLNNSSISTSQKVCNTDDKKIKGSDKLIEKLDRMTNEHQVSEINDMNHEIFCENKNDIEEEKERNNSTLDNRINKFEKIIENLLSAE